MKFTTAIFAAVAAAFASAGPASPASDPNQARSFNPASISQFEGLNGFSSNTYNNFRFNNAQLGYLFGQQNFNIDLFAELSATQGLNFASGFSGIFVAQELELGALLAIAQLQVVLEIAQLGFFNGFDLSGINLGGSNSIQWGIFGNSFSQTDLTSFISSTTISQTQVIAQQFGTF